MSDILLHLKKKKVEFLLSEDQEFITMIPFRWKEGLRSAVIIKHKSMNCPGTMDSRVLYCLAMKTAELNKGKDGHEHLISLSGEGKGCLVFNILTLKEGNQKEQKPGHWGKVLSICIFYHGS